MNVILPVVIFFVLCMLLALYNVLRPERAINFAIKWAKFSLKLYGLEGEIRPTPRAKTICRLWNLFMLLWFGVFIFLIFSGVMK